MTRSTTGSHKAEAAEPEPKTKKKSDSANEIFTFTDIDLTQVEDYVRQKPQNSLLIAFAAGFVASILLRRK